MRAQGLKDSPNIIVDFLGCCFIKTELGAVYMSPVCRAGPLKRGARLHNNFI